jgi:hypothetical protein
LNDDEESTNIVVENDTAGGLSTLLPSDSAPIQNLPSASTFPSSSIYQHTVQNHLAQESRQPHQQHQQQQQQNDLLYSLAPYDYNQPVPEGPSLDVARPFFDPTMLDLFPNGEMPDLSHFETSLSSLDYYELDDWNTAFNLSDSRSEN